MLHKRASFYAYVFAYFESSVSIPSSVIIYLRLSLLFIWIIQSATDFFGMLRKGMTSLHPTYNC